MSASSNTYESTKPLYKELYSDKKRFNRIKKHIKKGK